VEDVSLHWWTIYYHFGERPKLNLNLATMIRCWHKTDIGGPLLPAFQLIMDRWNPSSIEGGLEPHFVEKECCERVANYSCEDVAAATKWFTSISTIGLNLSQISVNYPSDTDGGRYGNDDGELSVDVEEAMEGSVGSGVDDAISFPPATGAAPSYRETSASQAVGPLL
jgi:hypothetical protein